MTEEAIDCCEPMSPTLNTNWTENVVYIEIGDKAVFEFRFGDTTVRMTSDCLLKFIIDNGGEVIVK